MAKIVFVLHEASRTGAPFTQLHLMRWLKHNTNYQMMLILLQGGDLVEEFKQLAEVHVVNKPYVPQPISKRIRSRLTQLYRPDSEKLLKNIRRFNPKLIFANTAVALPYAISLKQQLGVKLVSYLHELEITFFHISPENFAIAAAQVDEFVMGSQAVSNYYQKTFAVAPEKAHVIYDFIEGIQGNVTKDIRAEYGVASGVPIIGAMASIGWRKGPELFIEVARRVLKENSHVRFMWVGGKKNGSAYKEVSRDIRLLGLEDKIIMAGEQVDIHSYYKAFDVFLLTSREDPFPLVCLEAALAYTPVICFDEAGGMPEFVRDDAGSVVSYLDLDAMANKVLALLQDDALRQKQATVAHDRVLKMCTIDVVGPQIMQLIESATA
jgi:glycosyltransferase involved in cell wall biosynthesis